MEALVTDAHVRSVVGFIRGLRREDPRLGARTHPRRPWRVVRRGNAGRAVDPDAGADPAGFAAAVARVARAHGSLALFRARRSSSTRCWTPPRAELPASVHLPYRGPRAGYAPRHGTARGCSSRCRRAVSSPTPALRGPPQSSTRRSRSSPGTSPSSWAANDPLPAALLVGQTAGAMIARRLQARRNR